MSSVSDLIIRYNIIFTLQSAVLDDFISFLCFCFFVQESWLSWNSVYRPSWLQIHRNSSVSTFWVPELKAHAPTAQWWLYFLKSLFPSFILSLVVQQVVFHSFTFWPIVMVSTNLNLTESRITWQISLWACPWGLILSTLIGVRRPTHRGCSIPWLRSLTDRMDNGCWTVAGIHHCSLFLCLDVMCDWLPQFSCVATSLYLDSGTSVEWQSILSHGLSEVTCFWVQTVTY